MTSLNLSQGLVCAALAIVAGGAQAGVEYGRFDSTSGLTWIRASTLAEGESLGFRAATSNDFSLYLNHGGFNGPDAGQEYFTRTAASSLMGFKADAYLTTSMPYEYSGASVSLGMLDGDGQVGAMLYTTGRQQSQCYPTDYSYSCYATIYVNEAATGTLAEFESGQHDRYAYSVGGDWKAALTQLKQTDGTYKLSHFMVSSVPESGTLPLMMAGLLGMVLVVRRKSVA